MNVYSEGVERVGPVIPLGLTSDSIRLEKGICVCCPIVVRFVSYGCIVLPHGLLSYLGKDSIHKN